MGQSKDGTVERWEQWKKTIHPNAFVYQKVLCSTKRFFVVLCGCVCMKDVCAVDYNFSIYLFVSKISEMVASTIWEIRTFWEAIRMFELWLKLTGYGSSKSSESTVEACQPWTWPWQKLTLVVTVTVLTTTTTIPSTSSSYTSTVSLISTKFKLRSSSNITSSMIIDD